MSCSHFRAAALALLLTLPLAACGLGDIVKREPPPPCPGGVIVRDLSRVTVFQPGPGRDITDVMYEARLPRIAITCGYSGGVAEVETSVVVTAARGPANRERRADVRYFVAVLDGDNRILAKAEFENNLQFPPNLDRGGITDQIVQRIPLPEGGNAADHVIIVGFQLDAEQLAFNRANGPTGLLGPMPPAQERPLLDTGGIDRRPVHEQTRDPYQMRPR